MEPAGLDFSSISCAPVLKMSVDHARCQQPVADINPESRCSTISLVPYRHIKLFCTAQPLLVRREVRLTRQTSGCSFLYKLKLYIQEGYRCASKVFLSCPYLLKLVSSLRMVGMSSAFDPPNEKTSLRLGEAVAADDIPAVLPIGPSSQNGRLSRISPALHRLLRPLVKSSYPCPDCSSSTAQRLKYHLLLPPSGIVARLITLLLLATLTWAALWSLFPAEMLRKSSISGLYLLLLAGLVAGWLVERIKLAPLLGMLIVGVLFRNVYPIDFAKHIDRSCSGAIRNIALAIILTRAGLGLEQEAIKKRFWAVMSLAIVPTLSITAFITLVGHYMNGLPWLFSAALGFLISAVSPAVIVPILLVFQEEKLGQEKGLPSLLIAAAIICDVIAICGNSICLGIALSNGIDGGISIIVIVPQVSPMQLAKFVAR
ncbi:hypothetical protein RvY_12535-2 [Ramazzottius varieornatus]|uniref:Cation/H+ exchanger transmembrane domain-containing protein n=1 Tax=Ramazzottius varieornatus TaxID=947166 RepID=A0A1D1VJV8_RAMVA|nr:hypothetical protein RvY_12535-2 [Ramazzottius varieornatus]